MRYIQIRYRVSQSDIEINSVFLISIEIAFYPPVWRGRSDAFATPGGTAPPQHTHTHPYSGATSGAVRARAITNDLEPLVAVASAAGHEPHERAAAVALAAVLAARLVPRAHHVLRDQAAHVTGVRALGVPDDRHVDVPEHARRSTVLVQRAPAGRLSHAALVRVGCKPEHGECAQR